MELETLESLMPSLAERAVVESTGMDWQQSPAPGIWRKRLQHVGPPERGLVTSLVRFDPGASFPMHDHPEGEEILVLDGTFADEFGTYPTGTYMLSPDGSRHAPFTDRGCTLFVKLRQYAGTGRQQLALDTDALPWEPGSAPGIVYKTLYRQEGFPERVRLVRFDPGAQAPDHAHPGGEEIFVLEGGLSDEDGDYSAGTWARFPDGSRHRPVSKDGCLLYVRCGGMLPRP